MSASYFKCPAKINLFLKVIGKEDGYHNLESVLTTIDLYDDLEIEESDQTEIIIKGPYANKVDVRDNLFTQILDFFQEHYHISTKLKISVTKNIPVLGGLGGGSSNAAYFMMALNDICKLNLSNKKLQELSFNFGSDIAFFIATKSSALIKGRGYVEKILELDKPQILLINPNKPLSTKKVFEHYTQKAETKPQHPLPNNFTQLAQLPNHLEEVASDLLPEIKTILTELKNHNAQIAKMSGSGPSCFAIFNNPQDLKTCHQHFTQTHPQYLTKIT